MARLLKAQVKGHWDTRSYRGGNGCDCKDFSECWKKEQTDLDEIGRDNIMSFPVADGSALYKVVKEKPLTLAHIPYSDAYEISPAHIRGLTFADLVQQRKWNQVWDKFKAEKENNNV